MVIIAFILAAIAFIYYIFSPAISEEGELLVTGFHRNRAGHLVIVLIILFFLFWWLEPRNGHQTNALFYAVLFLTVSTSFLLAALRDIKEKAQGYYSKTYSAIMKNTKDAHQTIQEADQKLYDIRTKEDDILSIEIEAEDKLKKATDLENSLKTLEVSLVQREKTVSSKEKQVETEIGEKVMTKEREIKTRYEDLFRRQEEQFQQAYQEKMVAFVNNATQKMERRISNEQQQMVDDVFQFDGADSDDIFELQRAKEALEKERREVEKGQFLLDIDKKVAQASDHVLAARQSALSVKSENVDLRTDLKLLASDVKLDLSQERFEREKSTDKLIHQLELEQERRTSGFQAITDKLAIMDANTKLKLIEMGSAFSSALKDLEMKTSKTFLEVREGMSGMKLQFGKEILRLDGQQGRILTELEKYYSKSQQFVNQCQSLALEARGQNIEGKNLLNQVNHLHSQHRLEAKGIEQRLSSSMDKVALSEGRLANAVGDSMLKLKHVSDQQYAAMKDIALEKKDVGLLWKEKNMEHDMNLQEVRHQKSELEQSRHLFQADKSSFNQHKSDTLQNAQLTHRMYMKEQQHFLALQKAQNSGGWLSRWAKRIEEIKS